MEYVERSFIVFSYLKCGWHKEEEIYMKHNIYNKIEEANPIKKGMNMKIVLHRLAALLLLSILILSLSGCKSKADLTQDETSSSDTFDTSDTDNLNSEETSSNDEDAVKTEESQEDVENVNESQDNDTTENDSIEAEPFTFQDLSHNIYVGTIGDENVVFDIFPNEEIKTFNISYISDTHDEDTIYTCGYSDNSTIIYKDDSLSITLYETEEGVLSGSFSEGTEKSKDISLQLSHINMTNDPDVLYSVGTNKEIEAYATDIMKVIKNDDLESLSKMIAYPVSIKGGATAQNEKELIAMGVQAVITPELKEAMSNTYPRFMFSNYKGNMLGSGEYNIWFSMLENNDLKIIGINN